MKANNLKLIDLHMHSTVSDGTDTPEELTVKVKAAGIELFSITDHDSVKSSTIIPAILKKDDPYFITGTEIACRDEGGKYHILGYGYDPSAQAILSLSHKLNDFRMRKTKARIEFLEEEFGFVFPEREIEELMALDNPGKPHIANMMVRHGYAGSKNEAIKNYINKRKTKNEYIPPNEAIEAILRSGGIPVLAHPTFGSGDELILGENMEKRLKFLTGLGLKGIEAYYSGFTVNIIKENLKFAEQFNLYVTAGSDYHGTNKLVRLADTGLSDIAEGAPGLGRFLEAVSIISGT